MTLKLPPLGGEPRQIATTINQLIDGKISSVGTVTLTANAGTTTVTNTVISKSSAVLMFPATANAAAIVAATYVAVSGITEGESFVVTHTNDANTDKTFYFAILG